MDITDQDLSNHETTPIQNQGRILLLACGALAREILDIIDHHGFSHLDLKCLPAILHNTPEKIAPLIEEKITHHRESYDEIFVLYADCGTGGLLQSACERLGVKMLQGPHCYSFFEGNKDFAKREEFTAFYLTDFLVRQFDAFVWKPLGLDRHPELISMYFGNYTKLVYQAQNPTDYLIDKARVYANQMGLEFEYRPTGYGDLETELVAFSKITNQQ